VGHRDLSTTKNKKEINRNVKTHYNKEQNLGKTKDDTPRATKQKNFLKERGAQRTAKRLKAEKGANSIGRKKRLMPLGSEKVKPGGGKGKIRSFFEGTNW